MSARATPEIGEQIITPHGTETIVGVDQQRDYWVTDAQHMIPMTDVFSSGPPRGGSAEEIESWLVAPYITIHSSNVVCSCLCNNCNMLVITRGAEVTRTHQTLNSGCNCSSSAMTRQCPCLTAKA